MAVRIDWLPQKTSPMGDFVADAFLRLLDRGTNDANLIEPELLVRETAQNSWDARRTELTTPVTMSFEVSTLERGDQIHQSFADFFAAFLASRSERKRRVEGLSVLGERLKAKELVVLHVRDVGTWGLGGPLDATVEVKEKGTDRYVKFMLNIGDANQDQAAGGAFGLGRSVFWRMSDCRTVIVYSRCMTGKAVESRLVGLTLTKKFVLDGMNHTGRHWWTGKDAGRPIIGPDADAWARRLGIRPYGSGETGTTMIVLAPSCPAGPKDLATSIARSIELHLWPKYVSVPGREEKKTMKFAVTLDGVPVKVRDREELAGTVLGSYVSCFTRLVRSQKDGADAPDSNSILKSVTLMPQPPFKKAIHPKVLGRLVATVDASAVGTQFVKESEDEDRAYSPVVNAKLASLENHVALLRTPELVVCYKKVSKTEHFPDRVVAVFKSSAEANEYFRRAEDSSHSSWSSARLDRDKVVVDKFDKCLMEQMSAWYQLAPSNPSGGGSKLATDRIATSIGEWFDNWTRGTGGGPPIVDGPDQPQGGGGGGTGRAKGNVQVGAGSLEVAKGRRINVWQVDVQHPGPGVVQIFLREADEEASVMAPADAAPGSFPTFLQLTADREFSFDGPKTKVDFDVRPMTPNVTDVSLEVMGSGTTTLTVRALFDEGTLPVLGATLIVDGVGS